MPSDKAIAAAAKVFKRRHRDTCYPDVHDETAREAAAEILAAAYAIDGDFNAGVEAAAKIAETLKTLECWLPTGDEPGVGEHLHATVHGAKIAAEIRKLIR